MKAFSSLLLLAGSCLIVNLAVAQNRASENKNEPIAKMTLPSLGDVFNNSLPPADTTLLRGKKRFARMPIYKPDNRIGARMKYWKPEGGYFHSMPNYLPKKDSALAVKDK